jgi:elongator complex protein 1
MWSVGNYHWYLKQEFPFPDEELTGMIWDPELPYRIHLLTSDGRYIWVDFAWAVDQSKGLCETNNATVAVVDGARILLTPFRHQVVPPPMASQTLTLSCSVNQIAFSPPPHCDDMIVLTSDNALTLFKQNYSREGVKQSGPNEFLTFSVCPVASTSIKACLPSSYHFLRHLIWWTSDSLLGIFWQPDHRSDCILEFSLQIEELTETFEVSLRHQCQVEMPVLQLESNADTKTVIIEFIDGSIMVYNSDQKSDSVPFVSPWTTKLGQEVSFSLPCAKIKTAVVDNEEVVLGLSDWAKFYVNGKEVVGDCTSFAVHENFILLTTHSHTCRFIPLFCSLKNMTSTLHDDRSGLLSESIRRVERGSRIVTVVPGESRLVLQMPRGNLETIYPRALLLSYVRKKIDRLEYGCAFQAMKKHRINMNLLYDHNPSQFLESLEVVIHQLNSANNINLFLSDLKNEDVTKSMYPGWRAVQSGY